MKHLFIAALALILLVGTVGGVGAQTIPTTIAVGNVGVAPGQEVDVPLRVSNASNWYGVDVRMAFDPAVVQVVSVTRGAIPQPDFVVWERFDNVAGLAYYVTTQLNPTLPANGDGVIATVRLRGLAPGKSALTLTTQAASRDGELLPVVVQAGKVVVTDRPTAIKLRSFRAW